MALTLQFEDDEVMMLRIILDRAMNTWEPLLRPKLVDEMSTAVDLKLESLRSGGSSDVRTLSEAEGPPTSWSAETDPGR